jgi:hypothetical protein
MDAWVAVRNELNRFESNPDVIEIVNSDKDFSHRIISIQKTYILKRDIMLCSIYRGYVSDINKKLDSIEQSIKELMHKSATEQENGDSENAEKLMLEAEAYYEVKSLIRKDKWYSDGVAFLNEFDKNHPDLASAIYFSDVCDSVGEAINFYRSSDYWDSLYAQDGVLKFHPNRSTSTALGGYTVYHTGNFGTLEIQGGTCTLSSSSAKTISFPSVFSGTPTVMLTPLTNASGMIPGKLRSVTTSTFTAIIGGSAVSSAQFMWLAIYRK